MADERVLWLVYEPNGHGCYWGHTEEHAIANWAIMSGDDDWHGPEARSSGWRCSRIVVGEADGE